MSGLNKYKRVIPAGQREKIDARGDFIYIRELEDEIIVTVREVQIGERQGEEYSLTLRQDEKWYTAKEFDLLEFFNDTAVDQTLLVFAGFGDFAKPVPDIISVAVTTNPSSGLRTTADVACNDAAAVEILPAADDRACAIITAAEGNDVNLRVGDASVTANRGTQLQPGDTIAIRTKSAIYAIEESAGTTEVCLLEELETT